MMDRRAIGPLAVTARLRRAAHLSALRRLAVADMDLLRARAVLAEAGKARNRARNAVERAERVRRAARIAAGLDAAA